jgi:hypothetical protein
MYYFLLRRGVWENRYETDGWMSGVRVWHALAENPHCNFRNYFRFSLLLLTLNVSRILRSCMPFL